MTNEEIWKRQREYRAHLEALPGALMAATDALKMPGGGDMPDDVPAQLEARHLRTVLHEVARLQAEVKRLNADLRDEQREGQHSAGAAYSEGRHDGIEESRGY